MNYKNISDTELHDLISKEDMLIIDIRNSEDYKEGHIKNSINIPFNYFVDKISSIENYKNNNILIYCYSGHNSVFICNLLCIEGFSKVYNLIGGIIEYSYDITD